jgi:DNA processing protein
MDPDHALLVLARAPLPGAMLRLLLESHACAERALAAAAHGAGLGLDPDQASALRRPDAERLAADLRWLAGPRRRLVAWHDADYPPLLRQAPSPPPVLFVEGDPLLLWHPQVAIVGSRRPTPAGRERAERFARALAAAGWAVTSGLAQGIDTAAHAGALAVGRTIEDHVLPSVRTTNGTPV